MFFHLALYDIFHSMLAIIQGHLSLTIRSTFEYLCAFLHCKDCIHWRFFVWIFRLAHHVVHHKSCHTFWNAVSIISQNNIQELKLCAVQWELQCVLLLWLSQLITIPFNLALMDSSLSSTPENRYEINLAHLCAFANSCSWLGQDKYTCSHTNVCQRSSYLTRIQFLINQSMLNLGQLANEDVRLWANVSLESTVNQAIKFRPAAIKFIYRAESTQAVAETNTNRLFLK